MYITDIRDEDIEISVKVVIVGNGAVGKSSMIQRYCRGTFTKSYKKTIGVDFLEKQLRIHGEEVRLMLWDTAGQEEFDAITKAYYRGAQACVVAFSTTDRASLLAVRKWKKKVEDECGDIPMVLVQNKIDLITQSEIDQMEAERLAGECNMRLYRTSVKEDLNVGSVFQHLAENYVNKVKSYDMLSSPYQSLQIGYGNSSHSGSPTSSSPTSSNSSSSSTSPPSLSFPTFARHSNGKTGKTGRLQKANGRSKQSASDARITFQLNGATNRYGTNPAGGHQRQPVGGGGGLVVHRDGGNGYANRRFTNYCDPCTDYLNNPMFDSLHSRRRSYWSPDKAITLRPFSTKKYSTSSQSTSPINVKSACKVL